MTIIVKIYMILPVICCELKKMCRLLVDNIVITVCGVTWVLEISGELPSKVHDCLTIMLYT